MPEEQLQKVSAVSVGLDVEAAAEAMPATESISSAATRCFIAVSVVDWVGAGM